MSTESYSLGPVVNSHATNVSNDFTWVDGFYFYFFPGLQLMIAVLVFFGNGLVLTAFCKFERLRSITNYFAVSLAVADLCVGCSICICRFTGFVQTDSESFRWWSCISKMAFATAAFVASLYSVLLISFERYVKLFYPLRYEDIVRPGRVIFVILIVWMFSLGIAFLIIFWNMYETQNYCSVLFYYTKEMQMFILPVVLNGVLFTVMILYIRIWLLARKHSKAIGTMETQLQGQKDEKKKDNKVTKMMVTIFGVMTLAFVPFSLLMAFGVERATQNPVLWHTHIPDVMIPEMYAEGVIVTMVFINSAVNPLIYQRHSREFRDAFRAILFSPDPNVKLEGGSVTEQSKTGVTNVKTMTMSVA